MAPSVDVCPTLDATEAARACLATIPQATRGTLTIAQYFVRNRCRGRPGGLFPHFATVEFAQPPGRAACPYFVALCYGRSMPRCRAFTRLPYGGSVVRRGSSTGPPTVKW